MPKKLSSAQVASYERDGFVSPVVALTGEEAAEYRGKLEAFERAVGGPLTSDATDPRYRSRTHVLLAWVHGLARHPAILDAVEDLIGPDILVYTSTWFIKEPKTAAIAAWHQDATYFGLRPYAHVTAWLALTDATRRTGAWSSCREATRAGSGRTGREWCGEREPGAAGHGGEVDDAPAVHAPLRPGEFSLHHTLCLHRSQPNRSPGRRIGLGISYIPTHVRHLGEHRPPAMLVRGVDAFGHFELEPAPAADRTPRPGRRTTRSYKGYRAAYAEQVGREAR